MYYYQVHLPLGLNREFHYCSRQSIAEGARVLVSFNKRDMIGLCGERSLAAPDASVSYKQILEVLDSAPLLGPRLLQLGKWMADYYQCSIGSALFAMLPAWLIPDIEAELRWIGTEVPAAYAPLHKVLADGQFHKLSELRKTLKGSPILHLAEEGVNAGYLEVKRRLNPKDKPKYLNYLRLLVPDVDPDTFPARQKEALQLIFGLGKEELPVSQVSDLVSYSALKALAKKEVISISPKQVERSFFQYDANAAAKSIELTVEQLEASAGIAGCLGSFGAHLLFGITGSGKTEVYISIMRECLAAGRDVLFLIPEIALTPQMVERFQAEFGSVLAISHSQLSDRQRLQQWHKIARGECRIVIGARSAVFSPLPRLGLIIVDEEHEQSYKQDNSPRYNGRDLAVKRAQLEGVPVILGSATPSLESWHNQRLGRYCLHRLRQRPLEVKLPEVSILSLCEDYQQQLLSDALLAAISTRLERREQVILFQNRRGFSSFMQCLKCGELIKCPNCAISMYYHRDREEMQCHYCGHKIPSPRKCPHCGSFSFAYGAPGTQKVEQLLQICFPQAKLLRLDSDSARRQDTYKTMYRRMKDREVDILLGTQMISKGLDFPNVTLVGIVNADISLNLPDFRAAERTFQLCTQVAGRSGRADKAGEVIIQTYNPDHYAIVHARNQDYPGFAEEELSFRRNLNYPPYYRLARILYQCPDAGLLQQEMQTLGDKIPALAARFGDGQSYLLGPVPAPFAQLNRLYRQHIIIKGISPAVISSMLNAIAAAYRPPAAIHAMADVDPLSLM